MARSSARRCARRLVTAYPQGCCCDPWGPRSCAACATAWGRGVARPRSPEPGRRRSPRSPGRGSAPAATVRAYSPIRATSPARGRHRQGAAQEAPHPAAVALQLPARCRCPGGHGMALPRRSPGRLETSIVRLWCHRCGSVASDCAASAASARVLLSGIGALILTRPCGPGGWQARLAVAWCAWSSGGHRVLRVAQGGSAAAGIAELPRPAPAVQQPTGEVGA